jgi:hypothetical protein
LVGRGGRVGRPRLSRPGEPLPFLRVAGRGTAVRPRLGRRGIAAKGPGGADGEAAGAGQGQGRGLAGRLALGRLDHERRSKRIEDSWPRGW